MQKALFGMHFYKARGPLLMTQMLSFSRLGPPWLADHGQCLRSYSGHAPVLTYRDTVVLCLALKYLNIIKHKPPHVINIDSCYRHLQNHQCGEIILKNRISLPRISSIADDENESMEQE